MTMEAQVSNLPPPEPLDIAFSSVLLDFDGVLVPLADVPEEVVVDPAVIDLLIDLTDRMAGRVAVISGRSIAQLDRLLGRASKVLALSGSHGSEHRWHGVDARPIRPAELDEVGEAMRAFADAHPGVVLEEKSFGVGLHYFRAPEAAAAADALARRLAEERGLVFQAGRAMAEVRVAGADKGVAVARLMSRPPMAGTIPIMLGDDETDENGFAVAIQLGGTAIAVGPRLSHHAQRHLADPAAVADWLRGIAA